MFIKIILFMALVSLITATDTMLPGYCLIKGSSIRSSNECFLLSLQGDGNLVLYRDSDNQAIWSSGTFLTKSSMACIQEDGDFAILDKSGKVLWNAGIRNNKNSQIILQDDGNLVAYDNSHKALWASNTVTNC
ncbi:hypothetical protein PVAND_005317 [Polypedilum vanderplanki]|uniref:Bulb-type lectin domain-containing protein n=1 Tax=Polypedilum vanderplanki TaxID=319348 RepID=A0A9J6BZK6_POLVA|nr:hypothetical protein PVAND_005317 [Polypedilum vanderplanki]